MGFRVKIAPGVRVRISSRGVRTSIGPRIARVHVGAGRTAVSSGIGPFSVSGTVGGTRSTGRSNSGGGSYYRDYGPTEAQLNKQADAEAIQERVSRLTKAHLVKFTETTRRKAGRGPVPTESQLTTAISSQDLKGVSLFKRRERKAIKALAAEKALVEKQKLEDLETKYQQQAQKILDEEWQRLYSNDEHTVISAITKAFGDNEAKSAVLEVEGSKASIIVVAPDVSILPDRDWGVTAAGNLSVRKRTASSRDSVYFDMIFSQLLATLNEAFAVAPGIQTIDLVLVRNSADGRLGRVDLQCLGFGTFKRERLKGLSTSLAPYAILQSVSSKWEDSLDNNLKFKAVSLAAEPDLADLLSQVSRLD